MSHLVDRVALALAKSRGYAFRTKETSVTDLQRVFGPQIFEEARAAIEAMRELTPTMLFAASRGPKSVLHGQPIFDLAWQAVIDDALTPDKAAHPSPSDAS